MIELPIDVTSDHLVKAGRPDRVVDRRPPFRFVKRASNRFAIHRHTEPLVKVPEAVQPVAFAIERTAQIKEDSSDHGSFSAYHSLERNLLSVRACQSRKQTRAAFIGSRMNAKKRSRRPAKASTPMA